METWDIRSLAIEPHKPQVLRSDEETRAIAINLPAGEELQEHQVHERAYLLVADGEIEVSNDGETVTGGPAFSRTSRRTSAMQSRRSPTRCSCLVLSPWPGVGHPSHQG